MPEPGFVMSASEPVVSIGNGNTGGLAATGPGDDNIAYLGTYLLTPVVSALSRDRALNNRKRLTDKRLRYGHAFTARLISRGTSVSGTISPTDSSAGMRKLSAKWLDGPLLASLTCSPVRAM